MVDVTRRSTGEDHRADDGDDPRWAHSPVVHRAIWISDLHLGTRRCKASSLVEFLRGHRSEVLYLVGDVLDGWNLDGSWYWSTAQDAVVREIARWSRSGSRVVLLPGNHDELNVELVQKLLGPILVRPSLIHNTAEGRRLLVIHGHQFDGPLNPNRWNWMLGKGMYGAILRFNEWYCSNDGRDTATDQRFAVQLKTRVKRTIELLTDFRDRAVLKAARENRADGVICGHIHRAEQKMIANVCYINDGDWVHSCSALVEELDGELRLLRGDRAERVRCEALEAQLDPMAA
jgi:UDP-2,3-diacylglucosamine pyrophosphatase LpxH